MPRALFAATAFRVKEGVMRSIIIVVAMFGVLIVVGGCATFQNRGSAEIVADGCKTEVDSHCKDVTPGEGRVLACLYDYFDQLSHPCRYALYEAMSQFKREVDNQKI